jgi:hypothetical protein
VSHIIPLLTYATAPHAAGVEYLSSSDIVSKFNHLKRLTICYGLRCGNTWQNDLSPDSHLRILLRTSGNELQAINLVLDYQEDRDRNLESEDLLEKFADERWTIIDRHLSNPNRFPALCQVVVIIQTNFDICSRFRLAAGIREAIRNLFPGLVSTRRLTVKK